MSERPSAQLSRRYHHGDLRRELLRIARVEIARHGAPAVTLASLARLAGVSQPAPYRHFCDREALLEAVAADAFDEFGNILTAATIGCAPERLLESVSLAYVEFGEANVAMYRLMFASPLTPQSDDGSELDTAAERAFELLHAAVTRRSPHAARETAHLLWAQLHGLVLLKADGFIRRPLSDFVRLLYPPENLALP